MLIPKNKSIKDDLNKIYISDIIKIDIKYEKSQGNTFYWCQAKDDMTPRELFNKFKYFVLYFKYFSLKSIYIYIYYFFCLKN